MDSARKLTKEEIIKLKRGEVVWRESHSLIDCGKYGQIDSYSIYPMLVSMPGENGLLGYIDKDTEAVIEINNISKSDYFWNEEPEPGQIKKGMPIDDALKIFNKYEAEIYPS